MIAAIRSGNLTFVPAGFVGSALLFLLLSGWASSHRINSPVAWWGLVGLVSLTGALVVVVLIFDPPEYPGK